MQFWIGTGLPPEVGRLDGFLTLITDPKKYKDYIATLQSATDTAKQKIDEANATIDEANRLQSNADEARQKATADMAALGGTIAKHDARKASADQAQLAIQALKERTMALDSREQLVIQKENDLEAARAKLKSLVS